MGTPSQWHLPDLLICMNLIVGELPGHWPLSATDQNLPHPLETHLMRCNYMYYVKVIPGTQLTSISEGQPLKTKVFSNQNKLSFGFQEYIYIRLSGPENRLISYFNTPLRQKQ